MNSLYNPCPCESGCKFKFCCLKAIKSGDYAYLEPRIAKFPVQCFGADNVMETGITMAVVARKLFDDNYMMGCYLVDTWCLGVKDAYTRLNLTSRELKNFIVELSGQQDTVPYSYEQMRSMILGSIAYAQNIGFAPHQDWDDAKFLLEPHRSFEDSFTFGYNGKPCYVAGPHDHKIQRAAVEKVARADGTWMVQL